MFGAILAAFTPLITAAITAWNKSKDVTIESYRAAVGIASAQAQYMTAVLGHPLSPPSIMCYALAWRFAKVVVYDPILCPSLFGHECFTPQMTGGTAELAMIVASGMFFSGIANILKR